ncbi:Golgi apparatus membrane protein TVP38-like [Ananas comosus]|uniref:Golgi apparatus membrane protein TVP38-like n=1 Tax=Ananas comosus TaxID=4615 RepID=A0A6P5ENK7_ANACO|nr:Golgi apparatus membrane protein TVP38-like [Ananas comosus]
MTYRGESVDGVVVWESKMGTGDGKGDYVGLRESEVLENGGFEGLDSPCAQRKWGLIRWWVKVIFLCLFLLAAAAALLFYAGPVIIKTVVIPILDWQMTTFSTPVIGLILFTSIALFPALLVPSSPCMWIAGVRFGYGYGFLLITGAISIGMSLPFFIGSLFRRRIQRWLKKWPKKATIVRLAGEGDWFHQFRAVALLRISPFPYLVFNYASVATNVGYGPYICGSMVGTVHETFITIYSGRLLGSLADATNQGGFLSLQQIIYDIIGFIIAAAATAAITIYAKKTLQTLQTEEEVS